jgi:hypothetical protein
VDAGWSTGQQRGVWKRIDSNYGDYKPFRPKFPDLKEFVKRIKDELGLNVMIWVSPFWVGSESEAFKDGLWQAMIRTGPEKSQNINLCPRHPLTKPRIVEIANHVMSSFDLDGLWIDYLDSLPLECTAEHEHLYETMTDAYEDCINAFHQAVVAVKPDALIEFRLNHANLNSKRYITTAETNDTPHKYDMNRRLGVLLRSWVKGIVPKADPTMWNPNCADEEVARHLATVVMVGVPAISVNLRAIPPSHIAIIKAWLGFYHQHYDELLNGDFRPIGFEPTFPFFVVEGKREAFLYLGNDAVPPLPFPAKEEVYFINASGGERLVLPLENAPKARYSIEVKDCFLVKRSEESVNLSPGKPLILSLPPGGMAVARPLSKQSK